MSKSLIALLSLCLMATAADVLLAQTAVAAGDDEAVPASEEEAVSAVLDVLHDAASKAEGERYFALFASDAVFFGTAPGERWNVQQFRAYAKPRFENGQGWTYRKVERQVFLTKNGDTAWFDEELDNDRLGRCRGTGVLVKRAGHWKIVQYNLTLPIPDELAPEVVEKIRAQ